MANLTQKQKEFFKRKKAELNAQFVEPKYWKYTIQYVKRANQADVAISKNHIIFDYMAIGIACLAKELKNSQDKKVIYVLHRDYLSIGESKLYNTLFTQKANTYSLFENALSQLTDEPKLILDEYFSDKTYPSFMAGLLLYSQVTYTAMGYSQNPNVSLDFENFNDTINAQKLAFDTLKKLVIDNYLGSLQAFLNGDD